MPFRNMPLQFTARAQIEGNRVVFLQETKALLRYFRNDCDLDSAPAVIAASRANGFEPIDPVWWPIDEVGVDGNARLFKLTFRGDVFSQEFVLEECGPNRNLYEAFLDQGTVLLELDMGGGYTASLYLKLDYQR